MQTAAISVRCNGPMGDEKEMKIYSFGEETKPAILLLPGTCCHWKRNFGHVIPLLQEHFYVLCASYDGFDETEDSTFPNMLIETAKLESYIQKNLGGQLFAAYGCSLGGSFVGLMVQRKKIHIRQTWSVAAAFLTVLDGFITECSQRETLFPLLENALNTYQNCQSALQLKQLLQSTCKAVLDSLADEKNPRKSALVSQVQEYICLNFNHPDLRLETIASHFFVNPQHLSTVFSQESGVTLTSYINVCRMKKARQFLLEDSPSIQNVASLCGFSDSGYFSKCFRKYYGISPKNFVSLTEKNSYPGSIGI